MDNRDSGVFRLASVGNYLDALAAITEEMSLKERSNLIFLDRCLHELWGLGQNVILNWCPDGDGITLIVIPHYGVAAYSSAQQVGPLRSAAEDVHPKQDFFQTLLSARRCLTRAQLGKVSRLLNVEPTHLKLREPLTNTPPHNEIIEQMIKRYGITYVPNRGVSLFDIVGFSLLPPFEQMMQLNSLSYSLNSAQAKLLSKRIGVDFSRTTTGDGFYIWNRNLSLEGNVSLYHFMQLVLADNAIAAQEGGAQHGAEATRELPCRQQLRVPPSRGAQTDDPQLHRGRRDGRARRGSSSAHCPGRFSSATSVRRCGRAARTRALLRSTPSRSSTWQRDRSDSSRASSSPASASTRSAAISPGRS